MEDKRLMKKKSIFSYSIGKTALTLLNADKSLPAPYDWEDVHPETGLCVNIAAV